MWVPSEIEGSSKSGAGTSVAEEPSLGEFPGAPAVKDKKVRKGTVRQKRQARHGMHNP